MEIDNSYGVLLGISEDAYWILLLPVLRTATAII
jgi:hypothetical protein